MATYTFDSVEVTNTLTANTFNIGTIFISSIPSIGTSTDLLIYSAINGGRIDRRTDGVFVGATQTISNKTLITPTLQGNTLVTNQADPTKQLIFSIDGTTGTATVLSTTQTAGRAIAFPDLSGTVALVAQIPTNTTYVDLTTAQTVGGIKTFSSAPRLTTVATANSNLNVIVRNTGTGALELNTNMADLTSAQTFTNKTLTNPIISTISNVGVITVPTTTGTLALVSQIPTNTSYVDLTTAQTVGGIKSFSAAPRLTGLASGAMPTILPLGIHSSNFDIQVLNNIATTNQIQTLTNKTIDTANNQINISGTPLTSYINQDVRTTASPTFTSLGINTTAASALLQFDDTTVNRKVVLWSFGASNDHQFIGMGINNAVFRFQVNGPNTDYVFYAGTSTTTSSEVFRISGNGSQTSELGGKLVRRTASVTTVLSILATTMLTIPVANNSSFVITSVLCGYATSGTNANKSVARRVSSRVLNVGGTFTIGSMEGLNGGDAALNSVTLSHVKDLLTTNLLVTVVGTLLDTINFTVMSEVFYM